MTLETIITDLSALAATNGAPAHVAGLTLELARVVAEMRQAVEDNARLAQHERDPVAIPQSLLDRIACEDCTDVGPCSEHSGVCPGCVAHSDANSKLASENESLRRELERWRHSKQIEGDYVCPDSLFVDDARRERDTWKAEAEKLRTSAEAVERDVVERIADWVQSWCDSDAYGVSERTLSRGLAQLIRTNTWKETAQ